MFVHFRPYVEEEVIGLLHLEETEIGEQRYVINSLQDVDVYLMVDVCSHYFNSGKSSIKTWYKSLSSMSPAAILSLMIWIFSCISELLICFIYFAIKLLRKGSYE